MDTMSKMRNTPIGKLYASYLIPAVVGMVLMSFNVIIDGIFVSYGVGTEGLAGVNIAYPVFAVFFAIALWIGVGGGALYSISLGKNDINTARIIFSQSVLVAVSIVVVLAAICLWNMEKVAYLFGANETVLPYVLDYLSVILTFGIIYVFENVLSIFVRNDGNPRLAVIALVSASLLNIVFNYIFIFNFHWGVKGAASATVLSAAIGFFILLTHFIRKKRTLAFGSFRFRRDIVKDIMVVGLPSFAAEISMSVVTIGFNNACMYYMGQDGVVAYAIVNYLHGILLFTFLGMGAGLQPIASFHYGAGLFNRLKKCLRLSVITAIIMGVVAVIIGNLFPHILISIFNTETQEIRDLTIKAVTLFFFTYLFLGYNLVYAEFYQAIGDAKKSIIIILSQGMVLVLPLLWVLPQFLGTNGIWLALPVATGITSIGVYILNCKIPAVPEEKKKEVSQIG